MTPTDHSTWIPQLIAVAVNQRFDISNSYAVFDAHPMGESQRSLSALTNTKISGGIAQYPTLTQQVIRNTVSHPRFRS